MLFVGANGTDTAYTIRGAGEPLLLIHGGEADHRMFDGLATALDDRFTTIAYDQRDTGSTRNASTQYALSDLADDAAELIHSLGLGPVHVLGTSLGGLIAQVLAARHSDSIDRLVLISTWRVGRGPSQVNPDTFRALAQLRVDRASNASRIARYFFTERYLRCHPAASTMFGGSTRDEGQQARRSGILAQPVTALSASFDRPTLLVAGSEDRLIPIAETFAIAESFPSAQTAVIAGAGHVSAVEAPDRVADQVSAFLEADLSCTGRSHSTSAGIRF